MKYPVQSPQPQQAIIILFYEFTAHLLYYGFTGTLTFSYLDEELNGIVEGDLVMELQADDDSWTTYVGAVDQANNTVSYTFTEAVSFKAVTASASGATTVEDILQPQSDISVYPNLQRTESTYKEKIFCKRISLT